MKVFVTGSTGVLGQRTVRQLTAAGHDVTGLVRSPDKASTLAGLGAEAVVADLFDEASLCAAMAGHEVVVNVATHIPIGAKSLLPWEWRQDNLIRTKGSATVLAAARAVGVERLIQEAVSFVYPDCADEWITEQVRAEPIRTQRPSMVATDNALHFGVDGRTAVVLRFGLLYGQDRASEETLARVRDKKPVVLGTPDGWMSPLHPEDAAGAILAAVHCPSGVYNVNEPPVRRAEWARVVGEAAGTGPAKFYSQLEQKLFGSRAVPMARSQRVCAATFTEQTGWVPKISCVDGGWTA